MRTLRFSMQERPTWKTYRGDVIPIEELSTQHLANIIVVLAVSQGKWIESVPSWPALREEAIRRGLYPNGLDGGKRRAGVRNP